MSTFGRYSLPLSGWHHLWTARSVYMVFILIDASLPIFGSLLCYVPTYFCYAVNIRSDMLIHKSYAFRLKWFISLVFLRMICCITLREITTPILYSICFLKWNFVFVLKNHLIFHIFQIWGKFTLIISRSLHSPKDVGLVKEFSMSLRGNSEHTRLKNM